MKTAFSLIELIFVILIIGILSSIAIPRLGSNIDKANTTLVQNIIQGVQTSISNAYSQNILENNDTCPKLEKSLNDNTLFENVTNDPIPKKYEHIKWNTDDGIHYKITLPDGKIIEYDYNTTTCKLQLKQ